MSKEPTEQDVRTLAAVIGGAYYETSEFTIADYADGHHFMDAARAVAARITRARSEAWHEGHNAGVAMQHLIETGEDSWPDHLAVNPYGEPASLFGDTP